MPYGFTSPGANAGDAILKFLIQREMQNRQAMLDQAALRESEESQGIRKREMALREQAAASQEAERQTAMREKQNTVGVRGMMADAMTQGPLTPDAAKTIGIMGFREGVAPPDDVQRMLQPDERAQALADYESKRMIDASIQPAEDRYRTVGGSIFDAESRSFMTPPDRSGGQGTGGGGTAPTTKAQASADYTERNESRLEKAVRDLEPLIGPTTVGTLRAKGMRAEPFMSGDMDPTVDFDAALTQIKTLIGFTELNRMRQASPTGGALGPVSDREIAFLQAVAGSLNPNQSEPAFRAQLQKVLSEVTRVVEHGLDAPGGRSTGAGPGPVVKPTAADLIRKYGGGHAR